MDGEEDGGGGESLEENPPETGAEETDVDDGVHAGVVGIPFVGEGDGEFDPSEWPSGQHRRRSGSVKDSREVEVAHLPILAGVLISSLCWVVLYTTGGMSSSSIFAPKLGEACAWKTA